jgi:hypothetical protein
MNPNMPALIACVFAWSAVCVLIGCAIGQKRADRNHVASRLSSTVKPRVSREEMREVFQMFVDADEGDPAGALHNAAVRRAREILDRGEHGP